MGKWEQSEEYQDRCLGLIRMFTLLAHLFQINTSEPSPWPHYKPKKTFLMITQIYTAAQTDKMKGKSRKAGIGWELRAFLTRYTESRPIGVHSSIFDLIGHEDMPRFKCGEVMKPVSTDIIGGDRSGSGRRERKEQKDRNKPRRPLLEPMRTHRMEPYVRI
ncbi:hypothetical protein PIB30_037506 [Stylosanthes scabra]|uniref:Uncharacterized protein n=1 Tax=Stylosanthes scabra TaxID=79078 RepID=A0ABU6YE48_9FABA|nr:hypothetical protein [Stylosanthes scabra]